MDPPSSISWTSLATQPMTYAGPSTRRKPRTTYKSPSGGDSCPVIPFLLTSVSRKFALSSSTTTSPLEGGTQLETSESNILPKRKELGYAMNPPLPLYHPLGRLALSLPPLDPASVGLPTPVRSDDAVRRSSARARRPVAKLRDINEESPPSVNVTPIVELKSEVKEKSSVRKKRAGGSGSKRRRKEIDDGDATYPAKRTRMPRNTANQNQIGEGELITESNIHGIEVTPTPEPMLDTPEDDKPERRLTRSRGPGKRRGSSASEATSFLSVTAGGDDIKKMEEDKTSDTDQQGLVYDRGGDINEGG